VAATSPWQIVSTVLRAVEAAGVTRIVASVEGRHRVGQHPEGETGVRAAQLVANMCEVATPVLHAVPAECRVQYAHVLCRLIPLVPMVAFKDRAGKGEDEEYDEEEEEEGDGGEGCADEHDAGSVL